MSSKIIKYKKTNFYDLIEKEDLNKKENKKKRKI